MRLSRTERILAIACVAGVLAAGVLAARVAPYLGEKPDYTTTDLKNVHESAVSKVFGAFRVGLSDLIWLKTDEYLHRGVSYTNKRHREGEQPGSEGAEEQSAHQHETAEEHEPGAPLDSYSVEKAMGWQDECAHATTSIPAASEDFRGILGDLERVTKPYADQHVAHARMQELIPWYRILTLVNPKHVRGYVVGSYLIATKAKDNKRALEFLEEGEKNNPDSPEIEEALGRLYFFRLRDRQAALKHLLDAERLFLAKAQLTDDDKETLANAYRLLASYYEEKKNLPEMARVIEAGLRLYPNDAPLLQSKKKLAQMQRHGKRAD